MIDLRERHLGVLEGLTRFEAAQQHPADFANLSGAPDAKPQACIDTICYVCMYLCYSSPPKCIGSVQGGESQNEVAQRVVTSIEQIASQHPGKTPHVLQIVLGQYCHVQICIISESN